MSKKNRTRLSHCPVCGQKPKINKIGNDWYAGCEGYICSEEGIHIPTHNLSVGPYLTLEKAAKAWNHLLRNQ